MQSHRTVKVIRIFLPALLLLVGAFQLGAQTADDFMAVVQRTFPHWDLNHDGVLSTNEIDAAVADPQTTNEDAAVAAALKRASGLTKDPLPPSTLEGIAAASQQRPDLVKIYRGALKRISGATNRALFADGSPKLETIRQGKLGNCFCLAPLGALVHRDPAQAAGMFSLQTNGKYRVQLGKRTVEVAPPTDAEIAMTSSNEHEGIWVNLYEKAVGSARNEDRPPERRVDLPIDAERGGSAGAMLAYITGHEIARFSFKFAKGVASPTPAFSAKLTELRDQMTEATKQNRLMTCGTINPTTPGLTPNHAYAVLDYDAASDAVRLWNPHGQNFQPKDGPGPETGYPTANGVFQIPLEQFVRQFSGMAFELDAR